MTRRKSKGRNGWADEHSGYKWEHPYAAPPGAPIEVQPPRTSMEDIQNMLPLAEAGAEPVMVNGLIVVNGNQQCKLNGRCVIPEATHAGRPCVVLANGPLRTLQILVEAGGTLTDLDDGVADLIHVGESLGTNRTSVAGWLGVLRDKGLIRYTKIGPARNKKSNNNTILEVELVGSVAVPEVPVVPYTAPGRGTGKTGSTGQRFRPSRNYTPGKPVDLTRNVKRPGKSSPDHAADLAQDRPVERDRLVQVLDREIQRLGLENDQLRVENTQLRQTVKMQNSLIDQQRSAKAKRETEYYEVVLAIHQLSQRFAHAEGNKP